MPWNKGDDDERHPESPIRAVKANTARSYSDSLKVIRATVGARAVRAIVAVDTLRWYKNWRAPAAPGEPERVKRAHSAISSLRMILRFGGALGYPECLALDEQLAKLRFERSGRRESEMLLEHVETFIETAIGLGRLNMAIGVAAQFETMLRQKDIIGEWSADEWTGQFTWENLPGGILRVKTSKTGTPARFDLTTMGLLWPLLQAVPQAERHGAIVKGHDGQAIRENRYRKLFRQIANVAGIPTSVWSMDSRAGAITEALEAGANIETVARAATHSKALMTERYERRNESSITEIVAVRKANRAP